MRSSQCHVLTIIEGETEELFDAYEISGFQLAAFLQQFDVPIETDPEMLDRYAVGPDDADFVLQALGFELSFDFARYAYFIEAAENDT